MMFATSDSDFGSGPVAITIEGDLASLQDDDRLVVFADCEMTFTVVSRTRDAVHLGSFLTPWDYIHWRLERRRSTWHLMTSDRQQIMRCRRFYGMAQDRLPS
jgi:hypothetical protein